MWVSKLRQWVDLACIVLALAIYEVIPTVQHSVVVDFHGNIKQILFWKPDILKINETSLKHGYEGAYFS